MVYFFLVPLLLWLARRRVLDSNFEQQRRASRILKYSHHLLAQEVSISTPYII
jgi:hypothetical protein